VFHVAGVQTCALPSLCEDEFYKSVVDGQIVGGIILFEREPGHFHLDVLNIVPEYQNYGIGTRAIEFIEQTYPASKWTLDTPAYEIGRASSRESVVSVQ